MPRESKQPSAQDLFQCPHCNQQFRHKAPFIYSIRSIDDKAPIQIIDNWNIPYSTGMYILVKDENMTLEQINEWASQHTNFPFWSTIYEGKLYSKNTWDD